MANVNNIQEEQLETDWALALMSKGVIVNISLSRWRATTTLTSEMLGLRFKDEETYNAMQSYMKLGRQNLLPPETIAELSMTETRARRLLNEYSFDTIWGRFVPYSAFNEWEYQNNVIRNQFMTQAEKLGNEYDKIIDLVRIGYRKVAQDVWMRLHPEDKGGATASFIESFVDKVIEKIPPADEIVASFRYDMAYFSIPMPSFIEENIAKAEKIKLQSEMDKFNNELEKETKKKISNEYINKKREIIDGFLNSTVRNMRGHISELCSSVLESIGQNNAVSKLNGHQVKKLKGMIKKVKVLNFYDDKEISKLLLELEAEMDKIKGEVDDRVIFDKLKQIEETTKKEFRPSNFNPAISVLEI